MAFPAIQPELTPFAEAFSDFKQRYDLSLSQLSKWCGNSSNGMSSSTIHHLLTGKLPADKFSDKLHAGLTAFLQSTGKTMEQIQAELAPLFPSEDFMDTSRTLLPRHICEHFGLTRDPFAADPRNRREVFTPTHLTRLSDQVIDAINYQGFLAVTGDVGSGKTQLKKMVVDEAHAQGDRIKLIFPFFFEMNRLTAGSIVTALLTEFNQRVPHDLAARAMKLQTLLGEFYKEQKRVALVIDECHRLNDHCLTALKNFWEMGSGGYNRYLGIVLFGQPIFADRLREPKFRELYERIEIVEMWRAANGSNAFAKVAPEYLSFRLEKAGGKLADLFDARVVKELCKKATTPLALGNLANQALLKAYPTSATKVVPEMLNFRDDTEPELLNISSRPQLAVAK